jgi:regulatory protein
MLQCYKRFSEMVTPRKPRPLSPDELWSYSLQLLGRRPYSLAELKTKLSRRSESSSAVADTLTKLQEYGMVDDEKFSEAFASSRLQNDGFGRARVLRDLRAKRVPGTVAEKAVAKTFERVEERQLAAKFLLRKYRNKDLGELFKDQKRFASAYRKLRLAGFGSSVSVSLLKEYANGTAEWVEPEPDEDES